ncbi:MAG: SLC13 family permease [Bacteroidales bacterium]|nr:SLC13 family permease [Bacteroidales bacterium]MDD2323873.1 SLC13 family permease [Bacteroidales bacterium]MDD3011710.1 SLC13 family permease [Bacteroidales bacterium]MDD3962190.1 SLC13 family permease [Bacteroidales bacterium]MDY0284720.1 SLC13 family permease [Bacteroidales bacterium]
MNSWGIFVLLIILLMVIALVKDMLRPGLILFTVLIIFMAFGIITTEESLAGFANKGMITVAVLFLVSEGVRQTGALNYLAKVTLPKKKAPIHRLLVKIMVPVTVLSAFLNNTPVVIIFAPVIRKWAEKINLPPSKFLIPLSYATIFGGMCTLIGTSTNLLVHGLMLENGMQGISMFELAKVGIPVGIAGYIYMLLLGNRLLPRGRINLNNNYKDFREYHFEFVIPEGSVFVGNKIFNGDLTRLKDITVIGIHRHENFIPTKTGEHYIQANDHLVVEGKSDALDLLVNQSGIIFKPLVEAKANIPTEERRQVEAVLSQRFPGIGKTIRDFDFYSHYRAVVVAVHRNGEQITCDLDNITMKPGDNLILITDDTFIRNWGDSRVFYMVASKGEIPATKDYRRTALAILLVIIMVLGATFGKYIPYKTGNTLDMFYFASLVAVLMVWTKIISANNYTRNISWDILITIACAFGISKAMQNSGVAEAIASGAIHLVKNMGPQMVLAMIYLITTVFTEVITNNAAAALVFPIALSAAAQMGVNPTPFCIAITIAASASFSTPIGYQTNLIVQSLGNYTFKDYLKIGIPLNILSFLVSVYIIPKFWAF